MDENHDLYQRIKDAGFILIFRKHNRKMHTVKKGNVDTDITFFIMRNLIEEDGAGKIVLVSGDGDYFRMVEYLIEKDKFYRLLAPNKSSMSSLYKTLEPKFYSFLDQKEIKHKIQNKTWHRN